MLKKYLSLLIALVLALSLLLSGCGSGASSDGENPQDVQPEDEQGTDTQNEPEETPAQDTDQEQVDELTLSLEGQGEGMIHINQIGYRPQDQKLAVINSQGGRFKTFEVVNKDNEQVVLTGKITGKQPVMGDIAPKPELDIASRDKVLYADFSELQEPGTYYLSIPQYGKSYPFVIGEHVYKDLKDAVLKVMYYQRCGIALEEAYAGKWSHDACHLEDGYLLEDENTKIETTGGWHDAGDFGKYTSPAASTAGQLLLAYEFFPEAFSEDITIPESGNNMPDILDEAKYALDWMLKMQDPETGGVYHKETTKSFAAFVMPEKSKAKRYIMPISPTATGDFAAVMAMASRIYEPFDEAFADKALAAAEKAWGWLVENGSASGFKNPSGVSTGEYGDGNSTDERYWAAVELYLATGKENYHQSVQSLYSRTGKFGMGWADVSGFGTLSYLFADSAEKDDTINNQLRDGLIAEAQKYVNTAKQGGYKVAFGTGDYNWGSNGSLGNRGIILLAANELEPNEEFVQTAQDMLHYLLGRNALDQSYVTGFGSKPIMNPHHRPSGADGVKEPVPGMVSGGPNKNRQDPTAEKKLPADVAPARAFVDEEGSWSTNEITTYWNSPFVFIAGYFDR